MGRDLDLWVEGCQGVGGAGFLYVGDKEGNPVQ
jgi:hypothetical protein